MALIAHYPLNGDTKDYSGYGNDLIPHGYIPSDEFIGAHKTTTNSSYLITSKEWVYDQEVTLAIWAKETGDDGSSIAGLISDHHHSPSPSSGITMDIRGNDLAFAVGLGTSRPSYRFPLLFDSSEWCHYAITYNNGLVKLYQNGVMIGSRNVPPIVHVAGRVGGLGRWSPSYGGYYLIGSLSDARVYDHALSEKEIKELAKAKVLHYKFDPHESITTNIFDFDVSDRCWNGGGGSVCSLRTITSKNSMKFVGRSNLQSSSGYAYTYPAFPTTNEVHTLSMVVTNNGNKPVRFDAKLRDGSNGSDLGGGVVTNIGSGETVRVVTTSTSPVTANLITAAISSYSDVDGYIDIEVTEIQLQTGSAATGFVAGTRSSYTVKDSSGFGNDGTVAAATAPSWSEDSPVGRGSMAFNGSDRITTGKIFYNSEQAHTVSAWVKPTNVGVGTQNLVNFHSGYTLSRGANGRTLMYMNSGDNDHYVYGSKLAENKWTHVTWVYDKSSLRCQVYYDGELHASSSNFTASDVPSGFRATTIFGSNFVGNISDIRIYATALSPEDIKEIYQTRASIDNMGNLHAYESDEVSGDAAGISSQGIAKFTSINEVGRPVRYIRDWLNGSTSNARNHWVEIQAIDPSGTNVALGKSSPSALLTDGSTASSPYYSAGSGLKSVTVDLGDTYNITYLHIWHYWSDRRTYHNTKTEVSTDGTNWVTVFDSAVEGEYPETSEGKKILLYPDKVSIGSDGNIYLNEILEA